MADNAIALGVQVPDAMKNISGMLNFAGQAQNLQSSRQEFERKNIELQKERQQNEERVKLQEFMQNPDNYQTNGRIDLDKANKVITTIAPLTGSDILKRMADLSTAQTTALTAKQKLNQDQRALVAGPIGVLARSGIKDPAVYQRELENLKSTNPDNTDLHRLIDAHGKILSMTPGDHLPEAGVSLSQSLMAPETQQSSLSPNVSLTNDGSSLRETVTQPSVGGNQPSITMTGRSQPLTIAPGSRETTEFGPDKNPYIVTRNAEGQIIGTRGLGGSTSSGMPRFAPGDADAIPILSAEREAARAALSSAPIAHATNRGILEEIDKVTTGTVGPTLQKLFSAVGAATDTAEQRASAYDLVGKYLERNAIEAAKSMGPHTNAGLESAIKANGSVSYNPTAIKKLTKLNDAIVSGAELYQPGLEKAISADPQRGVLAKREFDQAWAQNFDPRIMELESAAASGNMAEIKAMRTSLGEKGVQELLRKAQNLRKLSTEGRL
jgi:hypothetical protein